MTENALLLCSLLQYEGDGVGHSVSTVAGWGGRKVREISWIHACRFCLLKPGGYVKFHVIF